MSENIDLFLTPKDLANLFNISIQGAHKFLKDNKFQTVFKNSRHKLYPELMKQVLQFKGFSFPKLNISVHTIKGGVGKTTLTHALGSRASAFGAKVLLVDLDQQANLSKSLGVYSRAKSDISLLEVYNSQGTKNPVSIESSVVKLNDFLDLIPSNLSIANLDLAIIQGTENIGTFFRDLLAPIRGKYDLIFFDCPPQISRVTSAVACISDKVLLPINADLFSIEGLQLSLDHLFQLHSKFGHLPQIHIIMNKFDARQKLSFATLSQLMNSPYKDYLCETYVSVSKEVENTLSEGLCLWNSKSGKISALEDINDLLIEILDLKRVRTKDKERKAELDRGFLPLSKSSLNSEVAANG